MLRRIHDEFMWLNKPFKITKSAIRALTRLRSSSELVSLKDVKNQIFMDATGSKFDRRAMTINDILEYDVKFASMVIGYKVYYSSKDNYVFKKTIYVAYEMIR